MKANMKKMAILIGLAALMASPALAGKGRGGGGKVKGGGSEGCVQYGWSSEQVPDPDFDYAAILTLSVADSCDTDRRGIESGEVTFSVQVDGQDACPQQTLSFDDLGSEEFSCEVKLDAEDLPARLEACIEISAEERDRKKLRSLHDRRCQSMDLDVLPDA